MSYRMYYGIVVPRQNTPMYAARPLGRRFDAEEILLALLIPSNFTVWSPFCGRRCEQKSLLCLSCMLTQRKD